MKPKAGRGGAGYPKTGAAEVGRAEVGPRHEDRVAPAVRREAPLQAGFGASIRHFGRAVDRNRIKRLGREAYRVQKQALLDHLREKGVSMAVFFIYTGKELPDHHTVTGKIGVILQKLIRETA